LERTIFTTFTYVIVHYKSKFTKKFKNYNSKGQDGDLLFPKWQGQKPPLIPTWPTSPSPTPLYPYEDNCELILTVGQRELCKVVMVSGKNIKVRKQVSVATIADLTH
jgi:hypothetical protein